jgi:spore maturation protein CgeB
LKLLCVTSLNPDTTSWARYRGLQAITDAGAFCTDPYFEELGPVRRRMEARLFYGPAFRRANKALLKRVADSNPEAVWVDKGYWIWPSTLKRIRLTGAKLIQHNTDALKPTNITAYWLYWLLRRTLFRYDHYLTSNLGDYHRLKGKQRPVTRLTHLGYDDERFDSRPLPAKTAEEWRNDVIFVGHYEPRTEAGICALVEAGIDVAVFGANWHKALKLRALRPGPVRRQLSMDEYVYALKGAAIGLCFVSAWNGNETAGRSFEIPASGTFLLAMRTPQHEELYREGLEAEFFGDPAELVRKASYYLIEEDARRRIAERGHARCTGSDYSWRRYAQDDWRSIMFGSNLS